MTKILLVDDEPDAISAVEFRLKAAGYEVFTAENGVKALQALQETKVELVLADFMMPEMNGLELARMVKGSAKMFDTRVILFSCNSDPEFRRRAIELGAVDFLSKTDGYPSIVKRVSEVAPATEEAQAEAETVVRDQLHRLALSLVDMLHMAGSPSALPEPTRYALDSARRIADNIERLTGTGGEATESEEEAVHLAGPRS